MSKSSFFPVIIIGSGISGLNFALHAAEKNLDVLIITKKKLITSATNFAQGGIAAVLSNLDSVEKHVEDTLIAGSFHNNRRAVEYMVAHSTEAVMRLLALGVPFATQNGELSLTREGGHSERRIAFVSDYTGEAIEKTLVSKVRATKNITVMEHTFAADLLVKKGRCYGVSVIASPQTKQSQKQSRLLRHVAPRNDKVENIYGGVTVLATGGIGQLYAHTTNPEISTGDGFAMAVRAGCTVKDMEFVQFHPTVTAIKGKSAFLISEAVRGEGALLLNEKGEQFMKHYDRRGELAPRDIVSQAIYQEEKKGPVFLDMRHKKATFVRARFPKIYAQLKEYGFDMTRELVAISPAAHYMCGGVKVNLRGETGIKNLYAFGEVSYTGVHGANRLASNSLLEALVFSDRILRHSGIGSRESNKIDPRFRGDDISPFPTFKINKLTVSAKKEVLKIRRQVQTTMWEGVGIVRTLDSLNEAKASLQHLRKELIALAIRSRETIELSNMLETGELIVGAALKRRKSLGCHVIMVYDRQPL